MRIMLGSVPPPKQAPGPVERAVKAIESEHGNVDLDSVARQANLSTRQFRRRCLEASGLTPKHLCRVLRFRHAWRLAHSAGQPDWTRIAAEADYFDQAHMIHEFREFTGDTPMAVFSNTR
jgi:AraC-like DNA-binding protein